MVDLSGRDIPACRQPAALRAEREPRQPGAGAAGRAQRKGAERAHQEDEGNPDGRAAEARRDRRTRRRQGGRRALTENIKNIDEVIKSLGSAARERLELGSPARKALQGGAQGATALHRRRRPCGDRRPDRALRASAPRRTSRRRRHQGAQEADQLADIAASGNLMALRHDRRASTNSAETLEAIRRNSAPRRRA